MLYARIHIDAPFLNCYILPIMNHTNTTQHHHYYYQAYFTTHRRTYGGMAHY